jgi:hypothetical protein
MISPLGLIHVASECPWDTLRLRFQTKNDMLKNLGHHDHLGEFPAYIREIRCGIAPQVPIHSNNALSHHCARVSKVKNPTSYPKFECSLPSTIQLSSLTIDLQLDVNVDPILKN